ncbi:MAG TPA: response regulator [Trichocoleus sp.]|jgi:DNA-binding response OmpR family regulator
MTTVLLVEDCLTDAELLTHYLRQAGLAVVGVTNCEEARTKLQRHKPDLVLLDVILPGKSGFELCHELKTNHLTEQIPVIICSTKGTDVDRLWGAMLGADAYLAKPIDQNDLVTTVMRLIAA